MEYKLLINDQNIVQLIETGTNVVAFSSPLAQVRARIINNNTTVHFSGPSGPKRILMASITSLFGAPNTGPIARSFILDLLNQDGNGEAQAFGNAQDNNFSIENVAETTLSNTDRIYVLITNVGENAATVTVGQSTRTIPPGVDWEYEAKLSIDRFTPIPDMIVRAASTKLEINQRWIQ